MTRDASKRRIMCHDSLVCHDSLMCVMCDMTLSLSLDLVADAAENLWLFCGDVGLFCQHTGLFVGNIGLLW